MLLLLIATAVFNKDRQPLHNALQFSSRVGIEKEDAELASPNDGGCIANTGRGSKSRQVK